MADEQSDQVKPIPQTLSHLIALNERYGVLLCLNEKCRRAVRPAAASDHLRRQHQVQPEIRKQVDQYIKGFPYEYDYSTVNLPDDGLAPQPVIEVVDGYECKHCTVQSSKPFRTLSRKALKQHGNKVHDQKRVSDEDLFNPVRLQSWFGKGRSGIGLWMKNPTIEPTKLVTCQSNQPSR